MKRGYPARKFRTVFFTVKPIQNGWNIWEMLTDGGMWSFLLLLPKTCYMPPMSKKLSAVIS